MNQETKRRLDAAHDKAKEVLKKKTDKLRALCADEACKLRSKGKLAGVLLGLIAFGGCCTHKAVIHEGVVLLRTHEHPELPEWELRRLIFLSDAEKEDIK